MSASSKHHRVKPSGVASPPPSSTSDATAEETVDPAVADVSPPSTSNDSDIRHMLETVIIV